MFFNNNKNFDWYTYDRGHDLQLLARSLWSS